MMTLVAGGFKEYLSNFCQHKSKDTAGGELPYVADIWTYKVKIEGKGE